VVFSSLHRYTSVKVADRVWFADRWWVFGKEEFVSSFMPLWDNSLLLQRLILLFSSSTFWRHVTRVTVNFHSARLCVLQQFYRWHLCFHALHIHCSDILLSVFLLHGLPSVLPVKRKFQNPVFLLRVQKSKWSCQNYFHKLSVSVAVSLSHTNCMIYPP